ncbi:MAG: efflux RND transporter periplasmic adaptor subunit [Thermoanaerobaculia bacterium]
MKRNIGIIAGVIVLIGIVIASLLGGGETGEKVYLEPVTRRDIQAVVSAPGQVDPKLKVNISAHVIGKIERLYFEEGDVVEKGDRLVDLERVSFTAAADQTASIVANRRIDVRRAEIALENARRNLERAQSLSNQGILTVELLERSKLEYDTARTSLASAQEAVRQAEAGLRQAREDLQRTSIVAPISGRIVERNAQEGEVVITGTMNNPGSVIAVLADLSELLVEADVGETEVVRVRQGQRARVEVDAIPGETFEGSVIEIGSSAAQRTGAQTGIRYFKVKITIDASDDRLRPGMTSQVEIITESSPNALSVPLQSVVERSEEELEKGPRGSGSGKDDEKQKYVFVADEGTVRAVRVETGISDSTHVVITAGLEGSEEVVTGPFRTLRSLKNGQKVEADTPADQNRQTESDDEEQDDEGS